MKLVILGAGEAFHDSKTNISILASGATNMLVDCGYNVPQKLWKIHPDKDFLDAVFISHFHADHVSGLPMLIMRMRQDKRTKALTLIGPEGFEKSFRELYDLIYKGFFEINGFPIKFIEVKEGDTLAIGDLSLKFTEADHLKGTPQFVPTMAIRISNPEGSVCYSSDTTYTERIPQLAMSCDVLIHDAYMPADSEYHKRMPAHSSPRDAGRAAAHSGAKRLVLFNTHRSFDGKEDLLLSEVKQEFDGEVIIPNEGQSFEI